VRIALGQMASGTDTAANLATIEEFAARAAAGGADLITFPEYATYEKKMVDASFPEVAQPLDGPVCAELARIAGRHRVAVVAGVVESSPDPARAYNTLVAIDPGGRRLAAYRKVHLFDAQGFSESAFVAPGPSTDPVIFTYAGVHIGLMTCYDLRFPEQARGMSDAGANLVLTCASWVPGEHKTAQWRTLLSARAIENSLYVAGACQAPPVSVGHSLLADPMGQIIAEAGLDPDVIFADISLPMIDTVREHFPTHTQRRLL